MRTSILALVLAAVAPVMAQAQSLTWQKDYAAAQERAAAQQKPLAIVFGQGAGGWQQLGGGSLTNEASDILAEKYVPCFVDTATADGRALARQFELRGTVGMVISDRKANLQAFWHEGPISADMLVTCLNRYADPQRAVTSTETNAAITRTSNYPPTGALAGNPNVPGAIAGYYYVGGSGSYCPTCSGCVGGSCGRRR